MMNTGESKIKLKKIYFMLLMIVFILLLNGCSILKTALYHEYVVKEYVGTASVEQEKILESDSLEKSGKSDEKKKYVVVFHGIYGTFKDMEIIAGNLEKEGYHVVSIQYPTNEDSIEVISEKYIKPVIDSLEKDREVNFIVHSMGSGILRYYLKNNKVENLGKVTFISPPSHGSGLSDNPVAKMLKNPLGEAVGQFSTKEDSFINLLGEPDYPCYIIIGNKSNNFLYSAMIKGKDDGMVPLATSRLESCDYKVIESTTHTSILKDQRTIKEIKDYLSR